MKIIMDYDKKQHSIQFSAQEIRKGLTKDLDVEILMNIVAYIDVVTKEAMPSQDLLAQNMGCSRPAVNKKVAALLENHPDIITREMKGTQGKIGYMKHSVYTFHIPIEIVTTKPQYAPNNYKPTETRSQAEIDEETDYNNRLLENM